MELGTITINLGNETINQITDGISASINKNINALAESLAKTIAAQLTLFMAPNVTEEIVETADEYAPKQTAPEVDSALIQNIYNTIEEDLSYCDVDGGNLDEVNALLSADIEKLTNGVIKVRFGKIRSHIIPNFRETEAMRAIHAPRWTGYVKLGNVVSELTRAYEWLHSQNSIDTIAAPYVRSEVLSETAEEEQPKTRHISDDTYIIRETAGRNSKNRRSGYKQGSYFRIKTNSGIIRMRRMKDSKFNAPMVIDRGLAADLNERGLTHVRLCNGQGGSVNMVFEPRRFEDDANAPVKTPVARMRVYGINHNSGEPTTFAVSSGKFQNALMKRLNTFTQPGGETNIKFTVKSDTEKRVVICLNRM